MTTIVHDPGNTYPIDVMYVWLSVDGDGNEGICAAPLQPGDMPVPLVAGQERIALRMRPFAEGITLLTRKCVRLVKFTRAEVMEVITP